jgi:hypothetical protein
MNIVRINSKGIMLLVTNKDSLYINILRCESFVKETFIFSIENKLFLSKASYASTKTL